MAATSAAEVVPSVTPFCASSTGGSGTGPRTVGVAVRDNDGVSAAALVFVAVRVEAVPMDGLWLAINEDVGVTAEESVAESTAFNTTVFDAELECVIVTGWLRHSMRCGCC